MAYDDDSHMEPHTHRMVQPTFNIDAIIILLFVTQIEDKSFLLQVNSSFVIRYEKCLELKKQFEQGICFVVILRMMTL